MKERSTIYIAGSLFSEAEVNQRIKEGEELIEALKNEGLSDKLEVFNPITNPFNDKSTLPEATDIFKGDYHVIRDLTKHFIVNLDNPLDSGVMLELGQVLQMIEDGEDIEVYPVLSDIRIATAGAYEDVNIPWGYNQYVIGALEYYGIHIYDSFDAALLGLIVRAQNDDLEKANMTLADKIEAYIKVGKEYSDWYDSTIKGKQATGSPQEPVEDDSKDSRG